MYKVLFAEDELLVRLGLQNAISWNTYEMELVALAENGKDAWDLFLVHKPDVVITDIRMEGIDGVELIKQIRKIDRDCAILVISSLDDFETVRSLIPYAINGYLHKASMDSDEICATLQNIKEYLATKNREHSFTETKKVQTTDKALPTLENILEKEDLVSMYEVLAVFSLKKEDRYKINDLAMHFIYDLVDRKFKDYKIIPFDKRDFILLLSTLEIGLEEKIGKLNTSIENFLGVRFEISYTKKIDTESLRAWFLRTHIRERAELDADISEIIRKAIIYMRNNHQSVLGLGEISHIMGLSSSYFSHLFKRETGKNFVDFLNEIRLEEVLIELKNSNEKISIIAKKHGFQNPEYFSRFFKKQMGVSAASWRQRQGEVD